VILISHQFDFIWPIDHLEQAIFIALLQSESYNITKNKDEETADAMAYGSYQAKTGGAGAAKP
jgi:hypothetical protein